MTPVLMAVCLLTGFIVGLRVNARRLATLRELLRNSEARHDAWNLQAKATDLAEVGPVTGQSNAVELFNQDALDALAEMRTYSLDEVIAEHGFTQAEIDAADDGERPCNNCGKPAAFAWETDGFPFAACNTCVDLWFPDGLPDHVVRLDQPSSEAECNIGGGTTPNEANAILHPDDLVWCAKSVEGWCAVLPNEEPEEGSSFVETVCTYGITLPAGYDHRRPDCPDCLAMLEAHPLRRWSDAVRSPGPVEDDTPKVSDW